MSNLSVETTNLHKNYYAEQYSSPVLFTDLGDSRWSSRTKKQVKKRGSVYSDRQENLLLPRGRRASLSVFGQHWPPPVRVQQKSQKQKWVQKEVQTGATYGIIQKINGSVKSYQQSTKRYVWYMKLLF